VARRQRRIQAQQPQGPRNVVPTTTGLHRHDATRRKLRAPLKEALRQHFLANTTRRERFTA